MDAETLYQQGVAAICDERDLESGQQLLKQSLRLDPNNDMAWVWLSDTLSNVNHKQKSLERALALNPTNGEARTRLQKLKHPRQTGAHPLLRATGTMPTIRPTPEPVRDKPPASKKRRQQARALSRKDQQRVRQWMQKARQKLAEGNTEGAIESWVRVLEITVDHEVALRYAVQQLVMLDYIEDAKVLVQRAIDAQTTKPGIYTLAMDLAIREDDHKRLSILREELLSLGTLEEDLYIKIIDDYLVDAPPKHIGGIIQQGLAEYPESQRLLLAMGDLVKKLGKSDEATVYYDRAAKQGLRTDEGKEAEKRLRESTPVLTDKERGSVIIALREVFGIGLLFLMLAWMDADIDLLKVSLSQWMGVILAFGGGYLLVTATSSPQQTPIAERLGGEIPEQDGKKLVIRKGESGALEEATALPIIPVYLRYVLGIAGGVLLFTAFFLVFGDSIAMLLNPVEPDWDAYLNLGMRNR